MPASKFSVAWNVPWTGPLPASLAILPVPDARCRTGLGTVRYGTVRYGPVHITDAADTHPRQVFEDRPTP